MLTTFVCNYRQGELGSGPRWVTLTSWSRPLAHQEAPLILTPLGVACATGDGVIIVVPRAASVDARGTASRGRHVRNGCCFASGTHLLDSLFSQAVGQIPGTVRELSATHPPAHAAFAHELVLDRDVKIFSTLRRRRRRLSSLETPTQGVWALSSKISVDGTPLSVPRPFAPAHRSGRKKLAWEDIMVNATEYRAMAAEHHRLAGMCRSRESREHHLRLKRIPGARG